MSFGKPPFTHNKYLLASLWQSLDLPFSSPPSPIYYPAYIHTNDHTHATLHTTGRRAKRNWIWIFFFFSTSLLHILHQRRGEEEHGKGQDGMDG